MTRCDGHCYQNFALNQSEENGNRREYGRGYRSCEAIQIVTSAINAGFRRIYFRKEAIILSSQWRLSNRMTKCDLVGTLVGQHSTFYKSYALLYMWSSANQELCDFWHTVDADSNGGWSTDVLAGIPRTSHQWFAQLHRSCFDSFVAFSLCHTFTSELQLGQYMLRYSTAFTLVPSFDSLFILLYVLDFLLLLYAFNAKLTAATCIGV
jgi:hypothetical protein